MPSSGDYIRDVARDWIPDPTQSNFFEQVNYVTTLLSSECENNWITYAETFDIAAIEFLVGITEFDEGDVARFIFRPKGLKRGGHLKSGRLRRAAGKVPGLKQLQGRKYSNGVRNLWIFDTTLQKVFFWWMLVGLSTDFLYRWTTLATGKASCIPGSALKRAKSGKLITLGGFSGGRFSEIVYDSDTVRAFGGSFSYLTKNNTCFAGLNVSNNNLMGSTTVTMQVQSNTGTGTESSFDQIEVGAGDSGSLVVNHQFSGPGSCGVKLKTEGFAVDVTDGDAAAFGT